MSNPMHMPSPYPIDETELVSLFLRLAEINGPSLAESPIVNELIQCLSSERVHCRVDDAAETVGGDTGNLIVTMDGTGEPLLLMAHLDTVAPTAELRPIVKEGMIYSSGDTILGADDRAGVAAICTLIAELERTGQPHRPLEVVFSVGEELGMLGAMALDYSTLSARAGYILDASRPVGSYVARTPSAVDINMTFTGRAAHSGVAVEQGINALSIALETLKAFPVGRLDEETTANIGVIEGGSAINVVPETVTANGEIRSFSDTTIDRHCATLKATAQARAEAAGGTVQIDCFKAFQGFQLRDDLPVVCDLQRACARLDLPFDAVTHYGGSDANVVNAKGIHALNLGVGVNQPHAKTESIAVADLVNITKLLFELVRVD